MTPKKKYKQVTNGAGNRPTKNSIIMTTKRFVSAYNVRKEDEGLFSATAEDGRTIYAESVKQIKTKLGF